MFKENYFIKNLIRASKAVGSASVVEAVKYKAIDHQRLADTEHDETVHQSHALKSSPGFAKSVHPAIAKAIHHFAKHPAAFHKALKASTVKPLHGAVGNSEIGQGAHSIEDKSKVKRVQHLIKHGGIDRPIILHHGAHQHLLAGNTRATVVGHGVEAHHIHVESVSDVVESVKADVVRDHLRIHGFKAPAAVAPKGQAEEWNHKNGMTAALFDGEDIKPLTSDEIAEKAKLGSGGRFKDLVNKLKKEKHPPHDPAAVAAAVGRAKWGNKRMSQMAHAHEDVNEAHVMISHSTAGHDGKPLSLERLKKVNDGLGHRAGVHVGNKTKVDQHGKQYGEKHHGFHFKSVKHAHAFAGAVQSYTGTHHDHKIHVIESVDEEFINEAYEDRSHVVKKNGVDHTAMPSEHAAKEHAKLLKTHQPTHEFTVHKLTHAVKRSDGAHMGAFSSEHEAKEHVRLSTEHEAKRKNPKKSFTYHVQAHEPKVESVTEDEHTDKAVKTHAAMVSHLRSKGMGIGSHEVRDLRNKNPAMDGAHSHVHHFQFLKKSHGRKASEHLRVGGFLKSQHTKNVKYKDGHLVIHHGATRANHWGTAPQDQKEYGEAVEADVDGMLNEMLEKFGPAEEDMMSGDVSGFRSDDTHLVIAGSPGFASKSIKLKPNDPSSIVDLSGFKMEPYKAKKNLKLRKVGECAIEGKKHHIFTAGADEHLIFPESASKLIKESLDEGFDAYRLAAVDSQTMVMRMVDAERTRQIQVAKGDIPNEPRTAFHAIAEYFQGPGVYGGLACLDEWMQSHYPSIHAAAISSEDGQAFDAIQDKPVKALGENVQAVKLVEGKLFVKRDNVWVPVEEKQGVKTIPELQNHDVKDVEGQPKAKGILKTLAILNKMNKKKTVPRLGVDTAVAKSEKPKLGGKTSPASYVPKNRK
jgi:hypothetical protein